MNHYPISGQQPWTQTASIYGVTVYYPAIYPYRSVPLQSILCISKAEAQLNQIWRSLWEQHVAWTRMFIISVAGNLADEKFVTERLLRNAPDMAAVIKKYYGDCVAARFNQLFTDHLAIAAEFVKAAKAGDQQAAANAEKRWYANADEIAEFLSSINPYWSKEEWTKMLHEHLKLTKDEAVYQLTGQYKSSIETYDLIEKQALEMADMLTKGIVQQFPKMFS
ncbi:hypothetical protein SAMN04488542_101137 [Fontibacillus panacisegetis]|uniref:Acetylglutamate kinase n=1 Tax=Fontibacillus panacisegetis TaxID=670482 RepID=A0A1G7EB94_9BACL|nr:acetylglutamate kinase [Fontibacillus panacisegetis]SDE60942.1 hypothetical protein SAMN04488542_101137 [Fontibacillus panacisegetis]